MKPSIRPRRRKASPGRLLGLPAALLALHVSAQAPCAASAACEPAGDPLAQAGGARTPRDGFRTPLTARLDAWSSGMSRQDIVLGRIGAEHDDDYLYRLPYGDGVSYPIIQAYGARLSHRGAEQYTLDFGMPVGTPVSAAREGVVVLVEDSHDGGCLREECSRLANFVVVLHEDGTTGEYFHLARGSVEVRPGQRVARGQWLARSGNTGYSSAPHLHFGVYRTLADGHTQSVPVRFETRLGAVVVPRSGARYLNAREQ
ncbi:MAG TPA: M23 family metallopeptidase [Gammaproteobacteria bacterium]|jgi:murein DD-endopeptidase MepM/ murein hydrolase activator NlpD|nr:M23 family metallopeptidase [Gammaproteobacteria bacterium]